MQILNPEGGALPTATDPQGWNVEAALDLQMASAACPNCKIILFEADPNSTSTTDPLFLSQNAAATKGANVVSNSWSGPEDANVASEEAFFNHAGVGYFAATGDAGYESDLSGDTQQEGPQYPSTSAFVTAVGGTTLVKATTGARGWTEGAWSYDGTAADGATGSSCSTNVAKPSWQTDTGCAKRTIGDISYDASPSTPVAVYDTYGYGGWTEFGGTSVASPAIASMFAASGVTSGITNASWIYVKKHHSKKVMNDVISGSDGSCGGSYLCTGEKGYDGPTGWGTPLTLKGL